MLHTSFPAVETVDTIQAARWINASPDVIRACIRKGELPATRFGKSYSINVSDLAKFANKRGRK